MTDGKIRPRDRHLMQPGMEYCYVDCDIDYSQLTAIVRISVFDLEQYRDEVRRDVSEHELTQIVRGLISDGWQHMRGERGREYEGHYFQRPKPAAASQESS
ncbi:hypothetical protein FBR02_12010 [Anaerolineae bacterium CFX9]|jgi:hypothetical protein|nr:hypothetical protein [Anaerolineae bacterium CFX9]